VYGGPRVAGQDFMTKMLLLYVESAQSVHILQVYDIFSDTVNSQPWKLLGYFSQGKHLIILVSLLIVDLYIHSPMRLHGGMLN
jgi:hypothetical protein